MKSKVKDLPINNPPDEEIIPLEGKQIIPKKDWLALVDGYCYVGRQRSWTWIKLDSARSAVPGSTCSANASVVHAHIY